MLKFAVLLTLCMGQTVQTLEAPRISKLAAGQNKRSFAIDKILKTSRSEHSDVVNNFCRYTAQAIICSLMCLDEYINRTKPCDKLFISFSKNYICSNHCKIIDL